MLHIINVNAAANSSHIDASNNVLSTIMKLDITQMFKVASIVANILCIVLSTATVTDRLHINTPADHDTVTKLYLFEPQRAADHARPSTWDLNMRILSGVITSANLGTILLLTAPFFSPEKNNSTAFALIALVCTAMITLSIPSFAHALHVDGSDSGVDTHIFTGGVMGMIAMFCLPIHMLATRIQAKLDKSPAFGKQAQVGAAAEWNPGRENIPLNMIL